MDLYCRLRYYDINKLLDQVGGRGWKAEHTTKPTIEADREARVILVQGSRECLRTAGSRYLWSGVHCKRGSKGKDRAESGGSAVNRQGMSPRVITVVSRKMDSASPLNITRCERRNGEGQGAWVGGGSGQERPNTVIL